MDLKMDTFVISPTSFPALLRQQLFHVNFLSTDFRGTAVGHYGIKSSVRIGNVMCYGLIGDVHR